MEKPSIAVEATGTRVSWQRTLDGLGPGKCVHNKSKGGMEVGAELQLQGLPFGAEPDGQSLHDEPGPDNPLTLPVRLAEAHPVGVIDGQTGALQTEPQIPCRLQPYAEPYPNDGLWGEARREVIRLCQETVGSEELLSGPRYKEPKLQGRP